MSDLTRYRIVPEPVGSAMKLLPNEWIAIDTTLQDIANAWKTYSKDGGPLASHNLAALLDALTQEDTRKPYTKPVLTGPFPMHEAGGQLWDSADD